MRAVYYVSVSFFIHRDSRGDCQIFYTDLKTCHADKLQRLPILSYHRSGFVHCTRIKALNGIINRDFFNIVLVSFSSQGAHAALYHFTVLLRISFRTYLVENLFWINKCQIFPINRFSTIFRTCPKFVNTK